MGAIVASSLRVEGPLTTLLCIRSMIFPENRKYSEKCWKTAEEKNFAIAAFFA